MTKNLLMGELKLYILQVKRIKCAERILVLYTFCFASIKVKRNNIRTYNFMLKYSWGLQKLKNVLACFKNVSHVSNILAMSTFNWLVLLVAADLQVCGVYSFRIDVSLKSSLTHLLTGSIATALKGLPYVINKALVSASNSWFKISFSLWYAL